VKKNNQTESFAMLAVIILGLFVLNAETGSSSVRLNNMEMRVRDTRR